MTNNLISKKERREIGRVNKKKEKRKEERKMMNGVKVWRLFFFKTQKRNLKTRTSMHNIWLTQG